jgi:hypothetical protein
MPAAPAFDGTAPSDRVITSAPAPAPDDRGAGSGDLQIECIIAPATRQSNHGRSIRLQDISPASGDDNFKFAFRGVQVDHAICALKEGNVVPFATDNLFIRCIEEDDVISRSGRQTVRASTADNDTPARSTLDRIIAIARVDDHPFICKTVVGPFIRPKKIVETAEGQMLEIIELIGPPRAGRLKMWRRQTRPRGQQRHRDRAVGLRIGQQVHAVRPRAGFAAARIRSTIQLVATAGGTVDGVCPAKSSQDVIAGAGRFGRAAAKYIVIFQIGNEVVHETRGNIVDIQAGQI